MNPSPPVPTSSLHDASPAGSDTPKARLSFVWAQIFAGAMLMLATLPGRTQGLGLITEPLLKDLQISHLAYAKMNLWATLLGALVCLPIGRLIDRKGARFVAAWLLPALALVVVAMSRLPALASVATYLFILILLTRALGQSALSVISISAANRVFKKESDWPAGAYTVLLSMLFMVAFGAVTGVIKTSGWRVAWGDIGIALIAIIPVLWLMPSGPFKRVQETGKETDLTLQQCLRQPLFWILTAGIALFTAVQSGIGLFNEALLAERGFSREMYHTFLIASALIALIGQAIAGLGTRWVPLRYWLALALFVQGLVLAGYSWITDASDFWTLAISAGISAGIITVAFFAIWGEIFGRRHIGLIMGAAQMFSVLASALGPLLFQHGKEVLGTYSEALLITSPLSVIIGLLILWIRPALPASLVNRTPKSMSP